MDFRSLPIWYPNSGYSEAINRSALMVQGATQRTIEQLLGAGWVDRRTRAIFVDFGLNTWDTRQAFPHLVRVAAEFSPKGEVELEVIVRVKSLDMLLPDTYGWHALDSLIVQVLVCMSILLLQTIIVTVSETMEMRMLGFEYLENMWNLIDISSVVVLVWALIDFVHFMRLFWRVLAPITGLSVTGAQTLDECQLPGARACEIYESHRLSDTIRRFLRSFAIFVGLHVFKFLKYATLVPALDIPFQAMLKVAVRVAALTFTVLVCLVAFAVGFTGAFGPELMAFNSIQFSLLQVLPTPTSARATSARACILLLTSV